ncbi:MAG: hypothetical protein ABIV26_01725, partial [Candidatus Limnocylindrales bacterium]
DGSCGSGTGPNITRLEGLNTFVIGGTEAAGAASARIFLLSRPAITTPVVVPADGPTRGAGYYATSLEGGPAVTRIEILDTAGVLLETQRVEQ